MKIYSTVRSAILSIMAILSLSLITTSAFAGWECTAKKDMVFSRYPGGKYASIKLAGELFSTKYRIKKVNRKKAVGKTADGTKFICRKI